MQADLGLSFVQHSSPFARRVSSILLRDLGDLLTVMSAAKRIDWQLEGLSLALGVALVLMVLGLYAWAFL